MKIATIGTGVIVHTFLDACTQIDGIKVTHMYSRKKESALPLSQEFNIPNIFTDLDEMMKEDFDVLYVASPNSLHFTQTKKALLSGKHVICEKPFVGTLKELDELIELANNNQVLLFEAITSQSMPNYLSIKNDLPKIGRLRLAQVNFTQYSSRYDKLREGIVTNAFDPKFEGGALGDIGIYNLHFVIGLFGKPISSKYYPNRYENGVDTSGIIIFNYPDFHVSSLVAKDCTGATGIQILGEDGSITVNDTPSICGNYTLTSNKVETHPSITQLKNHMVYEIQNFYTMWQNNDYEKAKQCLSHSRDVIEVFESLKSE